MARILIVDDDEMERRLLKSGLERTHDVVFAPNGRVAEDIVERDTIDLVVTDLVMPEVNGLRLIRDLRDRGEMMPIIAISGAAAEQLDLAEDFGAELTLMKPIDLDEFIRAVEQCLSRRAIGWEPDRT